MNGKNIAVSVASILFTEKLNKGARFLRPVALIGRASVSKTEGWGFESLLACQVISGWIKKDFRRKDLDVWKSRDFFWRVKARTVKG